MATTRPCPFIARALEKYAADVEVDRYLPGSEDPDVDCVVNVRPPKRHGRGYGERFASLYFVRGELGDGDVQVSELQLPDVRHVLRTTAKSCELTGIHEHLNRPGEPYFPSEAAYHVHLRGCNIRDLGKVLQAGGY